MASAVRPWFVRALCLAVSTAGCEHSARSEKELPPTPPSPRVLSSATPSAASEPAPEATTERAAFKLPPLRDVSWMEHLDLGGGHEAYITVPLGAREPRPLIVAVHGAHDRAEWSCGGFRMAAHEYAFVACPQGLKVDAERFAWDNPRTLQERVRETIRVARERFGAYIAEGPTVYVGFSQGATLAGPTLLDPELSFPVFALAEGGYQLIRDKSFLAKLSEHGVRRVLLVCGGPSCFQAAHSAGARFHDAGLEVLVGGDARSGHNLNGEMQAALRRVWPAFVAGLPNWRGFPEP